MKMQKQQSNVLALLTAVLLPIIGGGIVGFVTSQDVNTWYPTLQKPAWNPPNWIFGPVWTILYGLMGLASWLIWRKKGEQEGQVRHALKWYTLQLGLNLAWWWDMQFASDPAQSRIGNFLEASLSALYHY